MNDLEVDAYLATCSDYEFDLINLEAMRLFYECRHWPDTQAIDKHDAYCHYLECVIADKYSL